MYDAAALIALAALWGAATGLLLPRVAYRLSVEPDEAWRDACPAGHPLTGAARGWLGGPHCPDCRTTTPAPGTVAEPPPTERPAAAGDSALAEEAPAAREPAAAGGPQVGEPPSAGAPEPAPAQHAAHRTAFGPSAPAPLGSALVCAGLAAATGPRPELAVWLLLAPVCVLLSAVDRRVRRLPDPLTLPLAGAAPVLLGLAALLPAHAGSWSTALLGGLVLGGCYGVLFLVNPRGLGFGDVKFALPLGVALGWYGWPIVVLGAFAGFLLGGAFGAAQMLLRRASGKTAIPFGPFMAVGALLGLLTGALAAHP